MNFDEIVKEYIGGFGLFQIMVCGLMLLAGIQSAFNTVDIIFLAAVPDYWCYIPGAPEVANETSLAYAKDGVFNVTTPGNAGADVWWRATQCEITASVPTGPNGSYVIDPNRTRTCDAWVYDTSELTSTVVTEWDLVCSREWLIATVQSVYMVGMLIGVLLGGILSDRFGRRPVYLASAIINLLSRIVAAFSPNYIVFSVMRFIYGASGLVNYTAAFVLGMEVVAPKWRVLMATVMCECYALGYMMVAGVAYLLPDWSMLTLVLSIPLIPIILFGFCFCPESPRWLLASGQTEEAKKVLRRMARVNQKQLPEDIQMEMKNQGKDLRLWHILRSPTLCVRSALVAFVW